MRIIWFNVNNYIFSVDQTSSLISPSLGLLTGQYYDTLSVMFGNYINQVLSTSILLGVGYAHEEGWKTRNNPGQVQNARDSANKGRL